MGAIRCEFNFTRTPIDSSANIPPVHSHQQSKVQPIRIDFHAIEFGNHLHDQLFADGRHAIRALHAELGMEHNRCATLHEHLWRCTDGISAGAKLGLYRSQLEYTAALWQSVYAIDIRCGRQRILLKQLHHLRAKSVVLLVMRCIGCVSIQSAQRIRLAG